MKIFHAGKDTEMDRLDCAILVNSTPSYYYILPFFFKLLRRYAPNLRWDVVLATEVPDHPVCRKLEKECAVKILPIPESSKGFLESRATASRIVAETYTYCLPLQDDFLLEMPMNDRELHKILDFMDKSMSTVSARCMPCPGPSRDSLPVPGIDSWKTISKETDPVGFTFQATLWRTKALAAWYERISGRLEALCPKESQQTQKRKDIELRENIAENSFGQLEFWEWSDEKDYDHLAFERVGPWSNAVYLSPFPYRPTAIVRGRLETWAQDLAKREGIELSN